MTRKNDQPMSQPNGVKDDFTIKLGQLRELTKQIMNGTIVVKK